MSLFDRKTFDRVLGDWPGVRFVDQWDSHVAKVGDKVFAVLGEREDWRLVVKCSEESFEILTSLEGIGQAPYFAKRKWVSIAEHSPLEQEELEHYVRRSYELVAAGLTRKLRGELGIVIDTARAL
ncbi:MmcQ/YjbR family DNA-binding protein [Agrobacterium salinitolerans]|uniref:MmcQ/YjbR family DNA-binding protein n=1 Tax=Agrobacterium salinitolerans TaxID=1183413 RepID=A0A9X3KRZ1_9HYPH|nr:MULTISPECIES: MmcQ/YjbR family DNA-binding protein [Agrobacterium]MCZ7850822.1 MmcQ/YjbR family DNA-binding protein [Agrobacterium salinitolerans]MCZ7892458.1 MmcQ/YjbR family DNA-binding protein [Agrobacterium salinitolerans]MCZ7938881.1 MmcQ/YjbR family DNA-binding protein [Agrobacterium salinitolerans]MCZ7974484.1 MmcQ/YjbR family DNA-binding protein [Agrobacterium salinitolerans]TRA85641.1 MmcQ/YjbR family DNA-binding protein [Agrobacterium salinitolerans]